MPSFDYKTSYDVAYDPYDQEEQPPPGLPPKDHLRVTPLRRNALDSSGKNVLPKTSYDRAGGEVNVPLLTLNAPQTVRLALTRNVGTDGTLRLDIPHSNWSEPGKDEAQWVIEMKSPSPNYSKYFDTTPPLTSSNNGRTQFPKPLEWHPFAKNFEVPQWRNLAIHTGLCGLSYPFLMIFVIMGQGKSLFWSRFFVGAGSGILGVMCVSLMRLARGILEAASM